MPHFFGKNDECGFLPKAATPGWKRKFPVASGMVAA
jgi:hypothetical protein